MDQATFADIPRHLNMQEIALATTAILSPLTVFRNMRSLVLFLFMISLCRPAAAQQFTSGPIPLCDTSTFTMNVSGIGTLYPPGWQAWAYTLQEVTINITSDHPQTLQIFLTSPEGTTLSLSEFNGAGGENYTNTTFSYDAYPSITTGAAPFTGYWTAQGGSLDAFDFESADGTWTITVIDTACGITGPGPGDTWAEGWFDGNAGGFGFAYFDPGPPCWYELPGNGWYVCPGGTVDVLSFYMAYDPNLNYFFASWDGTEVDDPASVGAGTYWVQAFDPWDGCPYYADIMVYEEPQVSLGPDQIVDQCAGAGPVDLSSFFTLAGATQSWSLDGAPITTAAAAAATTPGIYQLIGSNYAGCNDTALVTLSINADIDLGADETVNICPDASADLTTLYNTTALDAEWYFNGSVLADPGLASDAGVYMLAATSASGCTDTAEVTLVVEDLTALGPDQSLNMCDNENLDLGSLYNTTGLTASWTLFGVPIVDPATVNSAGIYQLVITNASGCTDSVNVTIDLFTSPDIGADVDVAICEGNVVDLADHVDDAGLASEWSISGIPVADPTAVDATGVYSITATDLNGCSDTAHVDITVSANPLLGADQALLVCEGVGTDLTALYNTGSDATDWTFGGVAVPDPTFVDSSGTYLLIATNAEGCTDTAQVSLEIQPAPDLGADQSASICTGSFFDLTSVFNTSGLSSSWTTDGVVISDPTAISATGSYQVMVSNTAGCSDMAVVNLTVHTNPSLGSDQAFSLCPWQTVDLTTAFLVFDNYASYTFNGQPVSDPTAVHDPGTYVITITDANGCTDEAIAFITNMDCVCEADFGSDARCMQEPAQFRLIADSAVVAIHWDLHGAADNSTEIDPLVRFDEERDVLVTMQVTLTCGVVTVERLIEIQDCTDSCSIWMPSAFTPNNDIKNDSWAWYGECEPEDFWVEIYNRSGELIFRTTDPYTSWDGTYNGVISPEGVYAYRGGYRLPYQETRKVFGSITLLR